MLIKIKIYHIVIQVVNICYFKIKYAHPGLEVLEELVIAKTIHYGIRTHGPIHGVMKGCVKLISLMQIVKEKLMAICWEMEHGAGMSEEERSAHLFHVVQNLSL